MYRFIIFITCINAFLSCDNNPTDSNPPLLNYDDLSTQLQKAYEQNSQEELGIFFSQWGDLVPSISSDEFLAVSDTVQEAYRVFINFYTPTNLPRLTNGEHENFETNFLQVVIQNKLEIAVADTNPKFYYYRGVNLIELSYDDFRPAIPGLDFSSVYLTQKSDSVLYDFLFNPDGSYPEDHQERVTFLREAMQLTPHHWINDYHKITMPHADRIIFDESFTQALIQFRVFYQFGDAYFEKENGSWVLKESELTAIE